VWAGVDVGGRRKGFHLALVDGEGLHAGPEHVRRVEEAVLWLRWRSPQLVAVDSPRFPAPEGSLSRPEERELARAVCGIRYTPEYAALLESRRYYQWILNGFDLYSALEEAGLDAIECYPTASFTRWAGPRGSRPRTDWSRRALRRAGLAGLPPRLNQDERDAIGAALTARCYDLDLAESFGEIVVPL